MTVPFEPDLSILPVRGEMYEFRTIAGAIEYPHRSGGRSLQNPEGQITIKAESPKDANQNDTVAAKIALMHGEARRRGVVAGVTGTFLTDQPALTVAGFPGGQFLLVPIRRLGRAIGPGNDRADRNEIVNERRGHGFGPLILPGVETKPPPM